MAIQSTTVWEVRTTGSDNSGGGFNPSRAGAGTDYSQQDAAQASGTNLTVDATTNTKVTSAAHSFDASDVGNVIQITAGTGWTQGFYEVASVASGAATLDRSPAATGTSGGTWALGGALASPGKACGAAVAGNGIYVKAGTYSITSTTVNVSGGRLSTPGPSNQNPGRLIGYSSTRGDGGQATIQAASPFASNTLITGGHYVENILADGANLTSVQGFSGGLLINCKAINCTNSGFTTGSLAYSCEATACSGSNGAFNVSASSSLIGCTSHDNTTTGFRINSNSTLTRCLAWNNSGASSDGFQMIGVGLELPGCVAYNNGRHGFYSASNTAAREGLWLGCIAYGNAGYGYSAAVTATGTRLWACAAGGNTSGDYPAGTFLETAGFVSLTADPFVNAAGQNFALNTTAGGGAALRAAGLPSAWPGASASMVGYPDIGAAQHQDTGGGTTVLGNWIGLV